MLYHLFGSHCSGWNPNAARHAVADSIFGPWREGPNPCTGPDANITFGAQSSFILPVPGKTDAFIFLVDRWKPQRAIEGRYVWLPLEWENDQPVLRRRDEWDLSVFDIGK